MTAGPADTGSPCIGRCELDARQICRGCGRQLDEIARWPEAGPAERKRIRQQARHRLQTEKDR